jgi:pimeloyl-ACP methyl ester carboxylesterase
MFKDIDGFKLYYDVEGEGPSLILLHGWGGNSYSLLPLTNVLKKDFRVFTLDLPGFGRSSKPVSAIGGEEYKTVVQKFIDAVGIQDYSIIGHSFGGRIAIKIASLKPKGLCSLVLIDSGGIKAEKETNQILSERFFKLLKKSVKLIFKGALQYRILETLKRHFGSDDYRRQDGIMREILVKIVNEDLTDLLPLIDVPTLIIWGEKDDILPVSHGRCMKQLLKDAQLEIIPNAGHFPYLDYLPKVYTVLYNFLNNVYKVHCA